MNWLVNLLLLPTSLVVGFLAKPRYAGMIGTRHFLTTVNVDLPDRSYPIYIGSQLLNAAEDNLILKHVKSKKALIVTNTKIGEIDNDFVVEDVSSDDK